MIKSVVTQLRFVRESLEAAGSSIDLRAGPRDDEPPAAVTAADAKYMSPREARALHAALLEAERSDKIRNAAVPSSDAEAVINHRQGEPSMPTR